MGLNEEGLEDGGKRAGLDGCVVLAFAGILGLDFGQQDLSEGEASVLSAGIRWCSWWLFVGVSTAELVLFVRCI